jgi:predicted GIY-YIG superfamily endonuclease
MGKKVTVFPTIRIVHSYDRKVGLEGWYKPHVVYGLEDPTQGGELFYVGMTQDLSERYIQHLKDDKGNSPKCQRIRAIKRLGHISVARVIATTRTRREAEIAEAAYIEYYRARGAPLTNTAFTLYQDGINGQKMYSAEQKGRTWIAHIRRFFVLLFLYTAYATWKMVRYPASKLWIHVKYAVRLRLIASFPNAFARSSDDAAMLSDGSQLEEEVLKRYAPLAEDAPYKRHETIWYMGLGETELQKGTIKWVYYLGKKLRRNLVYIISRDADVTETLILHEHIFCVAEHARPRLDLDSVSSAVTIPDDLNPPGMRLDTTTEDDRLPDELRSKMLLVLQMDQLPNTNVSQIIKEVWGIDDPGGRPGRAAKEELNMIRAYIAKRTLKALQ